MEKKSSEKSRNPMHIIFMTVFIDMLGYGILIPVIPLLLADSASPFYLLPAGVSVNTGYILLGFLLAAFPLFQFLSAPILGQLSDKYGRKKILLISILGTCISYLLFAYAILTKNIPLLFFARSLDGATGGNIAVAQAAIADVTTPANRAKNFGLIGAAFGLGFIIGPYIGGKLSDPTILPWFHAATPFWFAAILSFLNIIFIYFFFKETHEVKESASKIMLNKSVRNILKAYTYKDLRLLFLTSFLFTAGFTFYTTFFAVYLILKLGFTQGNIGDFFAYVGVWIVLTQGVFIRLITRIKTEKLITLGLLGTGISILLYFIPTVWWGLLFIAPFFAFFNGVTMANLSGLISSSSYQKIQGEIMGINSSVQAFAQIFPPILAGIIASNISPYTPLIIAAFIIIFAGVNFSIFYKPHKITKDNLEL